MNQVSKFPVDLTVLSVAEEKELEFLKKQKLNYLEIKWLFIEIKYIFLKLPCHFFSNLVSLYSIYPDKQRQEAFREFFNMPKDMMPFCAIAIGYPDEEKYSPDRFDSKKVHFNRW